MSVIKTNFLYNVIYQVTAILAPIATIPYLSRVLGPENVGIYSYTSSITNYFVLFATLGMSTYGVRTIAAIDRTDREQLSRTFWSLYCSQLCVGLPIFAVYCVYSFLFSDYLNLSLIWMLWVASGVFDISWLLFGLEEFKVTALRSTATKIAQVALTFVLVESEGDLWLYVLIFAGSYLVNLLILVPFARKEIDFVRPHWSEVAAHFRPNAMLFLPVIATNLYTSMGKVVLGIMGTMDEVGYLEYADKICRIPLALILALTTVMLPRMTAYYARNDKKAAYSAISESLWVMQALSYAMCFGIAAVAPDFVPWFLGSEFKPVALLLNILPLMIPIVSMSNVIGKQYLLPQCRDREYTASLFCGSVVSLVLLVALVPYAGAIGASLAALAAELAVLLAQICLVKSGLPVLKLFCESLPFTFIGIFMFVLIRIVASIARSFISGFSLVAIEILIGGFFYCLVAIIYCVVTRNRHFCRLAK